ncbi:MAG: hypothetical protein WBH44_00775 [Proteocatella sp.]
MKVNNNLKNDIELLFQQYEEEVHEAEKNGYLKPNTTKTYLLHAGNFVK